MNKKSLTFLIASTIIVQTMLSAIPVFAITKNDDLSNKNLKANIEKISIKPGYKMKFTSNNINKVQAFNNENNQDKNSKKDVGTYYDFSNMSKINLNRGNFQGRQDLGIVLAPNSVIKIRQKSSEKDLTLELLGDDSKKERSITIPKNGDWVELKNSDSENVPFIKKIVANKSPEVECKVINGSFKPLPIYNYGDNEEKFFNKWDDMDTGFAFIQSERVQMLVPKKDKENLKQMKDFKNINELLQFYNMFINKYDNLLGLSYSTDNIYNKNVKTQNFIKANKNGVGYAYYSPDHIAENNDTIEGFLGKNWAALHEVGHGYEYNIKNRGLYLGDVFNNILGDIVERTYKPDNDRWLFDYGNMPREKLDLELKSLRECGKGYSSTDYRNKLAIFVYLIEFIGENNFSKFNALYREKFEKNQINVDYNAGAVFEDLLSEITGYNFKGYFDDYKINNNLFNIDYCVNSKYSKYKNVFILGDLITNKDDLNKLTKEYNLKSKYSLISTEQILNGKESIEKSTLNLNLQNIDFKNKTLYLKDGERVVKKLKLGDKNIININNILPGKYSLLLGNTFIDTINVKTGENKINVNFESNIKDDIEKNFFNQSIELLGLGDWNFANLETDLLHEKLKIHINAGEPHSYFNESYAKITVLNNDNKVMYEKDFKGNVEYKEFNDEIEFKPGYKIKVEAKEPSRVKIFNNLNIDSTKFYKIKNINEFIMTNNGLSTKNFNMQALLINLFDNNLNIFKNNIENKDLLHTYIEQLFKAVNEIKDKKIREAVNENIEYNVEANIPDKKLKVALNKVLGQKEDALIIPNQLQELKGTLNLNDKGITNLDGLQYCTNITELNLNSNNISNIEPLKGLTKLTSLSIDHGKFTDIKPLNNLKNLSFLNISLNGNLSDIKPISNLTNLKTLYMNNDNISNIESLKGLTNLTELNLNSNNISNIEPLKGLTKLTNFIFNCNTN